MNLAYTIGNFEIYDPLIATKPTFKIGRNKDYKGGWVWKTIVDCENFLNSKEFDNIDWGDNEPRDVKMFSIYELELPNSWEEDVCIEDNINYLLNNALILRKIK